MELIDSLSARNQQDADFFLHRISLANALVFIAGYKSLIDLPQTIQHLQSQISNSSLSLESLEDRIGGIGERIDAADDKTILSALMQGRLILLTPMTAYCFSLLPVSKSLTRSIEAPTTENVLRGSISAFIEDIDTNIGMIRKQANSDLLRMKSYLMGADQHKRIELLYMDGKIDHELAKAIEQQLEAHTGSDVHDLQKLSKLLGFPSSTLITKFNTTELPEEAALSIRKGRAVLLMDRFPFALIIPSQLSDMFAVENDRNFPYTFMLLMRMLRVLGVLTNVLMPGLYVALVSVNPDVLRIELALSIAESRVDVPYPAFVETLLFLIILELILEASVRLPKSIGPTITMVGGIILGQAVVSAKLVSNLLIIILAATTIASSTAVGFQNSISIRIFKYLLLILSAIYGVLGLLSGMVIVCAYLASITSFGVPYLHIVKPKDGTNE